MLIWHCFLVAILAGYSGEDNLNLMNVVFYFLCYQLF